MNYIKAYWRTSLLIAVILFISLISFKSNVSESISFFEHFDKLVHFCMYFTLSFVLFIENYIFNSLIKKHWIIIFTIIVGVFIEFLQLIFTENRSGNVYDAIFNTIGVILGSFCFYMLKKQSFIYKIMLFKQKTYKR